MMCIARAERDGTRAETRFRLSSKRTGPFKSVGASVQSTAGSRGVRISLSNAGYTTFGDGVRVLATHSIRQFPLHFPSRASPCATRFRTSSTFFAHFTRWKRLFIPSLFTSWKFQPVPSLLALNIESCSPCCRCSLYTLKASASTVFVMALSSFPVVHKSNANKLLRFCFVQIW